MFSFSGQTCIDWLQCIAANGTCSSDWSHLFAVRARTDVNIIMDQLQIGIYVIKRGYIPRLRLKTKWPKRSRNSRDRRFSTAKTAPNCPERKNMDWLAPKMLPGGRRFWRYQVDAGWAWVVCFASFFVHSVLFGTIQSFGTLFISLLNDFQAGESATGKHAKKKYEWCRSW